MNACQLSKKIKSLLANSHPKYSILVAFIQFLSVVSNAQNIESDSTSALSKLDSLGKKANNYFEDHPVEKVYLHFDKPFYAAGEVSWYKAYVVRGADLNPTDISAVLYIDWIDPLGKIVKHQRRKCFPLIKTLK